MKKRAASQDKKRRLPEEQEIKQMQQQQSQYVLNKAAVFAQEKPLQGHFFNNKEGFQGDIAQCRQLLTRFQNAQEETNCKINEFAQFVNSEEVNFDSGLPFYSCKNIIFTQYLICIKMYELFRLNAVDFSTGAGLRLYQRLVYLKTLILKLGPIQKKLEYQKNKLLRKGQKIKIKEFVGRQKEQVSHDIKSQQQEQLDAQQIGEDQEEEPEDDNLLYKPMLKQLIQSRKPLEQSNDGKYVAPKLSSVLPAEEKKKRREERQVQRRKAHLLNRFRGDIEQRDDAEQKDLFEGIDPRFKKRYEEKLRFQQENFTRLNQTKKQKYFKKQMMKNRFKNTLNDELKQLQLIRQLVQDHASQSKRPTPIGKKKSQAPNPKKRTKME